MVLSFLTKRSKKPPSVLKLRCSQVFVPRLTTTMTGLQQLHSIPAVLVSIVPYSFSPLFDWLFMWSYRILYLLHYRVSISSLICFPVSKKIYQQFYVLPIEGSTPTRIQETNMQTTQDITKVVLTTSNGSSWPLLGSLTLVIRVFPSVFSIVLISFSVKVYVDSDSFVRWGR